jgi:hypothetical protein
MRKPMTIGEMEEAYQQLKGQLLRGELGEEEFKAEVERLHFEDDQGQQWKLGWYTGQWYRHEQGQWVQGQPPERKTPMPMTAAETRPPHRYGREGRQAAYWLVLLLVSLLLVAATVLVIGWSAERWGGSSEDLVGAANTVVATETPRPTAIFLSSPTSVYQATPNPGHTSQAAATQQAPTASPTQSASQTPRPAPTSTTTTHPPRTPQPSPTATLPFAGRILFPIFDPSPARQTFDVYAVELQSGKRELVVGQASQPALSPDGKRLAYRSWNNTQRGILVRELSAGNTWAWIGFTEAARPSWSPDSQNIVFPSQQESDRQWRIYRTFGIEFDKVRRHGGDILGRVPVWLADSRIVYWECPLSKCGLYAMQAEGTNPIRLTANEHDTGTAASPDGSQVAFMSDRDGNWEIYVVSTHDMAGQSAQGQELRRLTKNVARDGLPTWSPDGTWLAFATDRDGAWAIWVTRPDGSGQRKLFDLGGPLEGEIANVPPGEQNGWTWETIAWGP